MAGYNVGYGKPPKHAQFKKGKTGNPKGRSKGHKNLATDLADQLDRRINVTSNGRRRSVTQQQAILIQLAARALQGDLKAATLLLNYRLYFEQRAKGEPASMPSLEEDRRILDRYFTRYRRSLDRENSVPQKE